MISGQIIWFLVTRKNSEPSSDAPGGSDAIGRQNTRNVQLTFTECEGGRRTGRTQLLGLSRGPRNKTSFELQQGLGKALADPCQLQCRSLGNQKLYTSVIKGLSRWTATSSVCTLLIIQVLNKLMSFTGLSHQKQP